MGPKINPQLYGQLNFNKNPKTSQGERKIISVYGTQKNPDTQMVHRKMVSKDAVFLDSVETLIPLGKNELSSFPHTIHKNLVEIDHRSKYKNGN